MTILAIDTTGATGSIAIQQNGQMLVERELQSLDGFAHTIFVELASVFEQNNLTLDRIDCFACASGPGSFTGVRVGMTAVKGLAEATGKPIAAISNLRALASFGREAYRAVILDARRGDVFAAVYDAELNLVKPEVVTHLEPWLHNLAASSYEFVTKAGSPFRGVLAGTRFEAMTWTETSGVLAGAIARCAQFDQAAGKLCSSIMADANYVRSSDAELFWRDK